MFAHATWWIGLEDEVSVLWLTTFGNGWLSEVTCNELAGLAEKGTSYCKYNAVLACTALIRRSCGNEAVCLLSMLSVLLLKRTSPVVD
jgi:hypothetical protein